MSDFYLTTPLYYVNASPHIGHAYTNVISDCMARFRRLNGESVFFLTGTDEHGEKIKKAAEDCNEDVEKFVEEKAQTFKSLWKQLNISYDFFIRTTEKSHVDVVSKVIKTVYDKGDIYKSKYRGFYCLPCESFWTESQVKEAAGCPDCKRDVEIIEEDNYFFKLSKYQEWLLEYLKNNPGFVKPKTRYNEVVSFLERNTLEDLCISRPKKRLGWGIDFPLDNNYVVYVWFDALINYISGAGYLSDSDKFNSLWPVDIHFMAKDILRHHAIFWPIMLKALELEMPRVIFAHGWWKIGEDKISKSRGNIVNPLELIKTIGVDGLRYFLLREVPVGVDGNFSWSAIINRLNSDLANDLGNLVYRTLNMAEKYFKGVVQVKELHIPERFKPHLDCLQNDYAASMEEVDFSSALDKIWKFINIMNKHVEDTKPWILWKEKKLDELNSFLFSLLEGIRITAIYIYPFMPSTSEAILRQLGIDNDVLSSNALKDVAFRIGKFRVKKEEPLFPRIESESSD